MGSFMGMFLLLFQISFRISYFPVSYDTRICLVGSKIIKCIMNVTDKNNMRNITKTSMMWPPQNFLLYNGAVIKIQVNEWINH